MPSDLSARVMRSGLLSVAALTAAAGWIAGTGGAAGVAGGGAIALLSFRWLAQSVASAAALARQGQPVGVGFGGIWLRHLAAFGGLGLLLGSGWTNPLAVILGLSVLPPILVVQGLRAARHGD